MYTSQNPDSLTTSFITYVKLNLPTNGSFIHLDSSMSSTVLASHM